MKQQFNIGQQFKRVGNKHPHIETVTDVLKTYNSSGELVKIRYVATHDFMGQTVTDSDIPATTIARGAL